MTSGLSPNTEKCSLCTKPTKKAVPRGQPFLFYIFYRKNATEQPSSTMQDQARDREEIS